MSGRLRDRATVVVTRDGKVLLVRGPSGKFVMPGGGIDPGEQPIAAAARELQEETGLDAERVEPLFVWESAIHRHHVYQSRLHGGDVADVVMGPEITDFKLVGQARMSSDSIRTWRRSWRGSADCRPRYGTERSSDRNPARPSHFGTHQGRQGIAGSRRRAGSLQHAGRRYRGR